MRFTVKNWLRHNKDEAHSVMKMRFKVINRFRL